MLTAYFWWEYNFLFMPIFSGMQLGHKIRLCSIFKQLSDPREMQ
jgi:hypothetical protein